MDFAQPVSFKNADIGRCAHQKPPEDEDGVVPAETIVQPEPGPTPAFPVPPTPVLAHVSDISYCFLVFFFLWSHQRHVEVLRPGIEPTPWQQPEPLQ